MTVVAQDPGQKVQCGRSGPVQVIQQQHKWCRIGQNDCSLFETCKDVYGATAPMSGGSKLGHCQ